MPLKTTLNSYICLISCN